MKNNDNYCVYMHINKINGKVYIGQTGVCNQSIFKAIKTGICAGGYHWKYYEEGIQDVG